MGAPLPLPHPRSKRTRTLPGCFISCNGYISVMSISSQVLVNHGLHSAFGDMVARSPLQSRSLTNRMAQALSQLAHWCPVFGELWLTRPSHGWVVAVLPSLLLGRETLDWAAGGAPSSVAGCSARRVTAA